MNRALIQNEENCSICPLLKGMSQTIEDQMNSWNLTVAEKAVCRALLMGKSLRKISQERQTNEITVRQQAFAVYSKAGMSGRHEISAYFLKRLFEISPDL
ncbi:MAG: helix-turn-helix transcriptional regulator [Pseudobdellovibrionaceae bacterium]